MAVSTTLGFGVVLICLTATVTQCRPTQCVHGKASGWGQTDTLCGNQGAPVETPEPIGTVDPQGPIGPADIPLPIEESAAAMTTRLNSRRQCRRHCRRVVQGCQSYEWNRMTRECTVTSTVGDPVLEDIEYEVMDDQPLPSVEEDLPSGPSPASSTQQSTSD